MAPRQHRTRAAFPAGWDARPMGTIVLRAWAFRSSTTAYVPRAHWAGAKRASTGPLASPRQTSSRIPHVPPAGSGVALACTPLGATAARDSTTQSARCAPTLALRTSTCQASAPTKLRRPVSIASSLARWDSTSARPATTAALRKSSALPVRPSALPVPTFRACATARRRRMSSSAFRARPRVRSESTSRVIARARTARTSSRARVVSNGVRWGNSSSETAPAELRKRTLNAELVLNAPPDSTCRARAMAMDSMTIYRVCRALHCAQKGIFLRVSAMGRE
mmetsp:Transcript_7860/g.20166  ORF Transcript_7860/g.20166 Transcript_7860/m.20166 type:complete len:280 (+) Transcript_7860:180-1019(+)